MCQLDGPETCVKLRELCRVSNCTYVSSQPARSLANWFLIVSQLLFA